MYKVANTQKQARILNHITGRRGLGQALQAAGVRQAGWAVGMVEHLNLGEAEVVGRQEATSS